jgi:hypothetical protein
MLDKLLKQDFLSAQKIIRSENGISLTGENGRIRYQFTDMFISYVIPPVFSQRSVGSLRTVFPSIIAIISNRLFLFLGEILAK